MLFRMTTALLSHARAPKRPGIDLHPDLSLALGRMHEVCGAARRSFAMWLAGQMRGPVLWIAPLWQGEDLHPDGMIAFADPARFLFASVKRAEDLLWSTEEALRSGAVPLVVADLPEPPGLTPVRRMHLAAEKGGETAGGPAPLGLLLTPGDGGAPGVETRWHMAPAHQGRARRWRLERRRARNQPPASWIATQTRPRAPLNLEKPC
jgi:protein ImuA